MKKDDMNGHVVRMQEMENEWKIMTEKSECAETTCKTGVRERIILKQTLKNREGECCGLMWR
jgi:hypothetical protein